MHDEPLRTSYRAILRVAAPLIISMSAQVIMQFIDALFLAWYSPEAIAAVAPAGMMVWLVVSFFNGAAGYTAVFVSQYAGARRPDRLAPVVWQGIWFGVAAGGLIALLALVRGPLFDAVGHAPEVRRLETTFFGICCLAGPCILVSSALSGFFAGRRKTAVPMGVQLAGLALNAALDYLLIFGKLGAPRLGMAGAAWATVVAQMLVLALLAALFLAPGARREFGTWRGRALDRELLGRLIRFGLPQGARYTVEMVAWTCFLFVVGRIGTMELASTNIAWRINAIAFFPIVGLSQAVSVVVGQTQGAGRPDLSARATWRGVALTQIWMVSAALLFVLAPGPLYALFQGANDAAAGTFTQVRELGAVLLRYVAAYCLLDGMNIVVLGALQAAGDTRWTLAVSALLHALFIGLMWVGDAVGTGLMNQWLLATVSVLVQGLVWLARFFEGAWRRMSVLEPDAVGRGP